MSSPKDISIFSSLQLTAVRLFEFLFLFLGVFVGCHLFFIKLK